VDSHWHVNNLCSRVILVRQYIRLIEPDRIESEILSKRENPRVTSSVRDPLIRNGESWSDTSIGYHRSLRRNGMHVFLADIDNSILSYLHFARAIQSNKCTLIVKLTHGIKYLIPGFHVASYRTLSFCLHLNIVPSSCLLVRAKKQELIKKTICI